MAVLGLGTAKAVGMVVARRRVERERRDVGFIVCLMGGVRGVLFDVGSVEFLFWKSGNVVEFCEGSFVFSLGFLRDGGFRGCGGALRRYI